MPDAIKKPRSAKVPVVPPKVQNRYSAIIAKVFFNHYGKKGESFEFTRDEFAGIASELGINLPKNVGDLIYSLATAMNSRRAFWPLQRTVWSGSSRARAVRNTGFAWSS